MRVHTPQDSFLNKIFYDATTNQNVHRIMNETNIDPDIAYPCARPKLACSAHQAQQRSAHLQIRGSIVKQLVCHIGLGRTEQVQEGPTVLED